MPCHALVLEPHEAAGLARLAGFPPRPRGGRGGGGRGRGQGRLLFWGGADGGLSPVNTRVCGVGWWVSGTDCMYVPSSPRQVRPPSCCSCLLRLAAARVSVPRPAPTRPSPRRLPHAAPVGCTAAVARPSSAGAGTCVCACVYVRVCRTELGWIPVRRGSVSDDEASRARGSGVQPAARAPARAFESTTQNSVGRWPDPPIGRVDRSIACGALKEAWAPNNISASRRRRAAKHA